MNLKNIPWVTVAKVAGVALLSAAGTWGGLEATKSASTPQPVKAAPATVQCPACSPTLNCPAIPKQTCDITVNGVKLK